MGRKPRIHFPGALYHIIARGNRREKIFRDEKDFSFFRSFLKDYQRRYDFALYAYVLMPNHIHLLLEVNEVPLSKIMQGLLFRFTRHFNSRYKKSGHLFQGRYKSILCDKDAYLLALSAYIHLNPVRAGMVRDPGDYPWSSYTIYLGSEKDDLLESGLILSLFSEKKEKAARAYKRFVKQHSSDLHRKDYYDLKDQRFLGEDGFIAEVRKAANEALPAAYDIPVPEIVSKVCGAFQIPIDQVYSPNRGRQGALVRSVVAYLGRKLGGYKIKTIAEHFRRDPVALSLGIQRLERRLREGDISFSKISRIEKTLIQKKNPKYLFTYA